VVKRRHSLSWLENSLVAGGTSTRGWRLVSFFELFVRNVDIRKTHLPIGLGTIATISANWREVKKAHL
jgi:hypothetical protein